MDEKKSQCSNQISSGIRPTYWLLNIDCLGIKKTVFFEEELFLPKFPTSLLDEFIPGWCGVSMFFFSNE